MSDEKQVAARALRYHSPSSQSYETRCKIRHGWSDNGLYRLDPIPNFNQQALDKEGNKVSTDAPVQTEPQIQGESPARAEEIIRKQNELIRRQKEVIQQLLEQNQELGKEIERLKTGKL